MSGINEYKFWGMDEKAFLTLMHLSQLAGFIIPFSGIILPIVMWVTNKDQSQEIDNHGKVIVNWTLSFLIYSIISMILIFIVVGIFALFALMIVNIIFVIIGAVKANNGILWHYPFSIKFFS